MATGPREHRTVPAPRTNAYCAYFLSDCPRLFSARSSSDRLNCTWTRWRAHTGRFTHLNRPGAPRCNEQDKRLQRQDKHFSGRVPSFGGAGRSATGRRDRAMPPDVTIPCLKPLTPRTIPRPGRTSRTTTPRRRKPPPASRTHRPTPSKPSSRRSGPAPLPRNALLPRNVSASRSPPFLCPPHLRRIGSPLDWISAGLGRSSNLRFSEGKVNTPSE